MANFRIGILLLLASIVVPLHALEPPKRDARVTETTGPVTIKTAENPKQAFRIHNETPLTEGDIIETSPQSRAEVTFDGETVFQLQEGSRLKIEKIFLKNTQLELTRGGILAKVKPTNRPGRSLIVKMPTAVVAIRGTEFGAETGGGLSYVGVFDEGHVVVAGAWGHEHVILGPNQETKVTLSNVPRPPRQLVHFRFHRNQILRLRYRAAYWRKNWKLLSAQRKRSIRQKLSLHAPTKSHHSPAANRKKNHRPAMRKHPKR